MDQSTEIGSRAERDALWQAIAKAFCEDIYLWVDLVQAAMLTPDNHIADYMLRYWLEQPAGQLLSAEALAKVFGQPVPMEDASAIRIHHILREDYDRHPHDHRWGFRSIVLMGWYVEELLLPDGTLHRQRVETGDTYRRELGQYHRITEVSPGGVLTMCLLGAIKERWGFSVDGAHVDSHAYLNY